jgi:hypothetical protein
MLREKLRLAMGESYRTLRGDSRHESGHYLRTGWCAMGDGSRTGSASDSQGR